MIINLFGESLPFIGEPVLLSDLVFPRIFLRANSPRAVGHIEITFSRFWLQENTPRLEWNLLLKTRTLL